MISIFGKTVPSDKQTINLIACAVSCSKLYDFCIFTALVGSKSELLSRYFRQWCVLNLKKIWNFQRRKSSEKELKAMWNETYRFVSRPPLHRRQGESIVYKLSKMDQRWEILRSWRLTRKRKDVSLKRNHQIAAN